jgi:hypothetical protein
MELLKKHIFNLEKELLKTETRQSAGKINELISSDFREFCSSGKIYYYNKNDVIDTEDNNFDRNWEIKEFEINLLSKDSILATYKLVKHSELEETMKYSLRSSIWKCFDGTWKMYFHQGTLTSKF